MERKSLFLSVIGANNYTLLQDLVAPAKLKEKSFEQLTEVLKNHYEPTRIVITKRFNFHHHS